MNHLIALTGGAPASGLLLAAIVAIGVLTLRFAPGLVERGMLRPYWLWPQRQFATLLTSGFLHADFAHLLFNAFSFWAFGFPLERRIGTGPFLALYTAGLLASDAGTWLMHRHHPEYRTLGASGAVLAVVFASIVYFPTQSIYILPLPLPIPAPLFAFGYLAYTLVASKSAHARVNHDAHLWGALAGVAFVAIFDTQALFDAWRHLRS
jgi:membrane associated rhomboid family serine protease